MDKMMGTTTWMRNEDLKHYQNIVSALSETIRIMAEIDQTIDSHGGWPIK